MGSDGLDREQTEAARAFQARLAKKAEEELVELEKAGKYSKAKYKLQVWIKSHRSIHKPLEFTLSFWASGKRLHGGGDESLHICRRNTGAKKKPRAPFGASAAARAEINENGCGELIPGSAIEGPVAVCPHCKLVWPTDILADSIYYSVPVEKAAVILSDWFRKLESNCDFHVKYRDDDIRTRMMAQSYGIAEARKRKGLTVYALYDLMRDLSAGATLETRLKALLLA